LNTLQAEKVSSDNVFNASDLANGNLAFEKEKKKKDKKVEEIKDEVVKEEAKNTDLVSRGNPLVETANNGIAVFPNPVTQGYVKLSFENQAAGKYQVQLLDLSGKLVSSKDVVVGSKSQIEEFRLPDLLGKGNYLIRVTNETSKVSSVTKIVVQ
jgi:hypothetical protein